MSKVVLIQYLFFLLASCSLNASAKQELVISTNEQVYRDPSFDSTRLQELLPKQIDSVNQYILKHHSVYSKKIAVFVDMKIPSSNYRFFVVNLETQEIISRGLCAHGSGSEISGTDSLQFSNVPNSYMTSLGLYRIGNSYQGNFGKSYKLHGLEKTNDKAYERVVVLHRYLCVPDEEQAHPICNSLGCPMLSEAYFEELIPLIDQEKKSVLMKIYY